MSNKTKKTIKVSFKSLIAVIVSIIVYVTLLTGLFAIADHIDNMLIGVLLTTVLFVVTYIPSFIIVNTVMDDIEKLLNKEEEVV